MVSSMPLRLAAAILLLIAIPLAGSQSANAGVLDRLRQDKTLRIAYRADAAPFSFVNGAGLPDGFMVDLCRAVAEKLRAQLNLDDLKVTYVRVTATDRLDAVAKGDADLLCEPTSATLSRRAQVDFSIATFIDGAGVLVHESQPSDFRDFAGKKIGVLAGTTTESALRNSLTSTGVVAEVVPAKTHNDGLAMLDAGQIAAYFADRSILMSLVASSKAPDKLHLADNYLTLEPYALALPRGDEDFRLAVDRALSHIYRSGEIAAVMQRTFGNVTPSNTLQMVYLISALPD
jgi:polar amino acid transport system substrate-binding protein/glutamate/aspartate transport system substrate-binding protein